MPKKAVPRSIPGLSYFEQLSQAHFSALQRHVDSLHEAWSDCTCDGAELSHVTKAWNKMFHAWCDNAADLCQAYTGLIQTGGNKLLTFVIDQQAQASAPQQLELGRIVANDRVAVTPLRSLDGPDVFPDNSLTWAIEGTRLEVTVAVPGSVTRQGRYMAVIYERAAGDPQNPIFDPAKPPPRGVLAVVLVTFIAGDL